MVSICDVKAKEKARESGKFRLQDKNINWTHCLLKMTQFVGYEYLNDFK